MNCNGFYKEERTATGGPTLPDGRTDGRADARASTGERAKERRAEKQDSHSIVFEKFQ